MSCPECGGEQVTFAVPDDLREHLPAEPPAASICTRCLYVSPVDEPPAAEPDFGRVSEAFPDDPAGAAALACLLAVIDSLALYRQEADAIAAAAERRGVDVMLVLDRLAADESVDPHFDVRRRARQLEQLI